MHKNSSFRILIVILTLLSGCANVQRTTETEQNKGSVLIAGVGDTIVNIQEKKNLPNIFGKADMFGRTTQTGSTTVQFLGASGSIAKFVRNSINVETGETTMNSTPLIIPTTQTSTISGFSGNSPISANVVSNGYAIIKPNTPQPQYWQNPSISFVIDTQKTRTFIIGGTTIEILKVNQSSLEYLLR